MITTSLQQTRLFTAARQGFCLGIVLAILLPAPVHAQANVPSTPAPEKKRLCVGPIVAIKTAEQKAAKAGKESSLQQVIETLETTLIDQINASRKFEVVARKTALKSLLSEQDFGESGNVDPATAAKAFKLAGAEYLVLTTITDFVMGREALQFNGIGVAADRESVRVSCSIQIYDTSTGKLIESARFRGKEANVSRDSTADGESLTKITDRLAADIFNRIVEVIYPGKVVSKFGTQITINRGDGTGIAVGQLWSVFALGQELTDPDTGEKLGRNEAEVGTIRIVRLGPKLSFGETIEDTGILVGAIVRQKAQSEPSNNLEASPPKAASPKSLSDKVKNDL